MKKYLDKHPFALSCVLWLPVLVFYTNHFICKQDDLTATGFIAYDMPYYMANAHEYAEHKDLTLLYGGAFRSDYINHNIYFQPQTFVLGLFLRYTNIPANALFLVFGAVFGILAIRTCLQLYDAVLPKYERFGFIGKIMFLWGGGLFFFTGFLYNFVLSGSLSTALANVHSLDPFSGWWFLNLGRNFLFPFEAYYHFLFFSTILYLHQKKHKTALCTAFIMGVSHPFTGIALLLILNIWAWAELIFARFLYKKQEVPTYFPVFLSLFFILALYYYLVFLTADAEHLALTKQWTLNWHLKWQQTIIAYILVVGICIIGFKGKISTVKQYLANPFHRLLFVWLVVNLLLENHELFITAHQPLHFTRGYVWSALFLIGLPIFLPIFEKYWLFYTQNIGFFFKKTAIIAIILFFCTDNLTWFGLKMHDETECAKRDAYYIVSSEQGVLNFLSKNYYPAHLLITDNYNLQNLLPVYTNYRLLVSHQYNTTNIEYKAAQIENLLEKRRFDTELQQQNLLVVLNTVQEKTLSPVFKKMSQIVYTNEKLNIYKYSQN